MKTVTVNGRSYNWPSAPLTVICCDGSEPAYMEIAMEQGLMPNLRAIIAKGENRRGHSVIPSFTNPNNLSIVTGRPPEVHGICGNYLIDPATGQETMMNDPKWLRAPTIFEAFQKAAVDLDAKTTAKLAADKKRADADAAAPRLQVSENRRFLVYADGKEILRVRFQGDRV